MKAQRFRLTITFLFSIVLLLNPAPLFADSVTVEVHGDDHHGSCCHKHAKSYDDYDTSSKAHRGRKTISLLVGTDGYGLGFFHGKHASTELGYSSMYVYDEEDDWAPSHLQGGWEHFYTLKHRRFLGNSFNLNAGLRYTMAGTEADEFNDPRWSTLYATAGFDNQWQWDFFTIGIDWMEYQVPIAGKARLTKVDDERSNDSALGFSQSSWKPHSRMEYFKLTMGLAF
jgi:hypothetical protein